MVVVVLGVRRGHFLNLPKSPLVFFVARCFRCYAGCHFHPPARVPLQAVSPVFSFGFCTG